LGASKAGCPGNMEQGTPTRPARCGSIQFKKRAKKKKWTTCENGGVLSEKGGIALPQAQADDKVADWKEKTRQVRIQREGEDGVKSW